jgi:predicted permease
MNIGSTVGLWTIGIALLAGGDWNRAVKNIFGINQLAVALALLLCFCHIPVPDICLNIFNKLGNCSVPLILMLIGASIYTTAYVFKDKWDMFYMTVVRLVILPLCIIGILKLLPLPEAVYKVAFVVAAMPVSASSSVITRRFGGSPEFAGQAIIFTTIASAVTIPLLLLLL